MDDASPAGADCVRQALAETADVVVFDFLHAVILAPETFACPSVLFTHNVEAEIFRRHAEVNTHPVKKAVWRQQFRKMQAYEQASLRRFDTVVAVSQRDADTFDAVSGAGRVATIPTGVDLAFSNIVRLATTTISSLQVPWIGRPTLMEFPGLWMQSGRRLPHNVRKRG